MALSFDHFDCIVPGFFVGSLPALLMEPLALYAARVTHIVSLVDDVDIGATVPSSCYQLIEVSERFYCDAAHPSWYDVALAYRRLCPLTCEHPDGRAVHLASLTRYHRPMEDCPTTILAEVLLGAHGILSVAAECPVWSLLTQQAGSAWETVPTVGDGFGAALSSASESDAASAQTCTAIGIGEVLQCLSASRLRSGNPCEQFVSERSGPTQHCHSWPYGSFLCSAAFDGAARDRSPSSTAAGGALLIHCAAGVSRAPAVAAAVLAAAFGISVHMALRAVGQRRRGVAVNAGFLVQLLALDATGLLCCSRRISSNCNPGRHLATVTATATPTEAVRRSACALAHCFDSLSRAVMGRLLRSPSDSEHTEDRCSDVLDSADPLVNMSSVTSIELLQSLVEAMPPFDVAYQSCPAALQSKLSVEPCASSAAPASSCNYITFRSMRMKLLRQLALHVAKQLQ